MNVITVFITDSKGVAMTHEALAKMGNNNGDESPECITEFGCDVLSLLSYAGGGCGS